MGKDSLHEVDVPASLANAVVFRVRTYGTNQATTTPNFALEPTPTVH
ncbi:MAG TPA: hypothetical protein VNU95_10175 [Candidatus Acidoferrales bacterium]|jgi:hypothetical protein|nr:hypothetical protein [Candidatus Acidoferrales bacterium]